MKEKIKRSLARLKLKLYSCFKRPFVRTVVYSENQEGETDYDPYECERRAYQYSVARFEAYDVMRENLGKEQERKICRELEKEINFEAIASVEV